MTKKLRKDLGLDDLAIAPETMPELALMIKRTRLGEIRLD